MKRLSATTALTGIVLFLAVSPANALPTGGQVSAGQASISSSATQTTIDQTSQKAVINWNSFNVNTNETVQFVQPSSSAIALNRVTDSGTSQIDGQLLANGKVWLINPNGVVFGKNAQVNVGGLLATTSNITDANFMAGNYNFTPGSNPNATISNAGNITVADAGLVTLVAPNVINSGVITAKLGNVTLASGDSFTVDLYGDGLINLQASPAITQQIVSNSGAILANGGTVTLTTAAASTIVNSLINMDGLIEADSVGGENGTVTLYAQGSNAVPNNVSANKGITPGASDVLVSGVISASGYGSGQTGGSISVLGDNVAILSGAVLDASGDAGGGYIKIGGDFHGAGTTPMALNTYVDSNSLILANAVTSGNGGNVAVWSDNNTWFEGNIIAEGGATSGNGGFVETSGHGYLDANGYVDLTAPNGIKGTYLLDPATIEIYGNVTPAFVATDGSINLASSLQLWLDASNASSIMLSYNSLGTTASGSMGTNTITVGSNSGLVVGERIQLGGSSDTQPASVNDNASGSGVYTITGISGTTVTLDANLATAYSSAPIYGGYVSQINDLSSQGNNFTQATTSAQPLWISNGLNGLGVLSFNGTSDNLTHSVINTQTTDTSTFIVSQPNSASVAGATFKNGASDGYGIGYGNGTFDSDGNHFIYLHEVLAWYDSGVNYGTAANIASSIIGNGSTVNYLNSNSIQTIDATPLAPDSTTYIGGYISRLFDGYIPEVLFYNTALSANAITLVNQYESAKWNIALTPPGTGATEAAQAMASNGYSVFADTYLERLSQTANIDLSATGGVTLDLQGDNMALAAGKSLSITAGTTTAASNITFISPGTITTSDGSITLTPGSSGSIVLNANSAVNLDSNGGAITLGGPLSLGSALSVNSGNGNVSFASTIDGASNLSVSAGTGTVTFSGAIGGTTPIGSLYAAGSDIYLGGNVTTAGQTVEFNGPVILQNNVAIDTTDSSNYSGAHVAFDNTVDGADNLSVNSGTSNIIFGGAIGNTTRLSAVSLTTGNSISLPAIKASSLLVDTTGTSNNITLGGNINANGTGNAIVLGATGNFLNSGDYTLSASGGRWIIYSSEASLDTMGGLNASQDIYAETYGTLAPAAITSPSYSASANTWVYSGAAPPVVATSETVPTPAEQEAVIPPANPTVYVITPSGAPPSAAPVFIDVSLANSLGYSFGNLGGSFDGMVSSGPQE